MSGTGSSRQKRRLSRSEALAELARAGAKSCRSGELDWSLGFGVRVLSWGEGYSVSGRRLTDFCLDVQSGPGPSPCVESLVLLTRPVLVLLPQWSWLHSALHSHRAPGPSLRVPLGDLPFAQALSARSSVVTSACASRQPTVLANHSVLESSSGFQIRTTKLVLGFYKWGTEAQKVEPLACGQVVYWLTSHGSPCIPCCLSLSFRRDRTTVHFSLIFSP